MNKLNEQLIKAEGLLCGLILKDVSLLNDYHINKQLLNDGLFYIGIAERLLKKGITHVDEVSFYNEVEVVGLKDKYEELGGFSTIKELTSIVNLENSDSIYDNWCKYNLAKSYSEKGILDIDVHFDKITKMTASNLEDYMIALLNDVAIRNGINGSVEVSDLASGYEEAIEEWNKGNAIGYRLGYPILNYTLCGLHKKTLSFLLAHSGNGKTSFAIPMGILPVLESGEKIMILANEQSVDDWRQMLLATILFNKIKYRGMNRQKLLYGNFSENDRAALRQAVEWLDKYKGSILFTELKDYGIDNIRRIIKKYSKMNFGVFILDTLKPEDDSSDKSWGQFSETAKELFVLAKQCDIALLCTAQLATSSYGRKYLDLNSIGKSRAIAEVASQVIMFRSMQDVEKEKLKVWRNKKDERTGKITSEREEVELKSDKDYIILFIAKNRYGESNIQLVYERNMSFNTYYEIGYTTVEYDGFGR